MNHNGLMQPTTYFKFHVTLPIGNLISNSCITRFILQNCYLKCFTLIRHSVGETVVRQTHSCTYGGNVPKFGRVFQFISSRVGTRIPPEPAIALLLNYERWPKLCLPSIIHCMVAVKISTAASWKQKEPPDFASFIVNHNIQTQFELMFSIKNGKVNSFGHNGQLCYNIHPA